MESINEKLRSRQVKVLFLIMFTDMIGFGMSIPLFGLLFGSKENFFYLGNQIDLSGAAIYFGVFAGLFGLGQFIANPILGALSDTVGRKPILTFAIFGTFISRIIFLFALLRMNIFWLFFSRFVDGATGGIIALSNASITDTTTPEERGKYIGKTMAGFSLGGFVAGPILFTLFSYTGDYYSVVGPFVLSAILSGVAFLACVFLFPETLAKEKIQKVPNFMALLSTVSGSMANLKKVFQDKSTRPFFQASLVFFFAFVGFNNFTALYLFSNYHLSPTFSGLYFLIVGVVMTVMQAFVAYKIIQKYPIQKSIAYLLAVNAILVLGFTFLYQFENSTVYLLINAGCIAMFASLINVSVSTYASKIQTEFKGALLGAFSSLPVLAAAVSPLLLGLTAGFSNKAPFLISAFLMFTAGLMFKKALK